MTWRGGLLRLWAIGSIIWLIGWTLFIRQKCLSTAAGAFLCAHDSAGLKSLRGDFAVWSPAGLYLLGFLVPLAALLVGALVVWVMGRRRGNPSS